MLVVQVDVIDAQPLEGGVARLAHVLRAAVHADEGPVGLTDVAELGGQHRAVAPIRNGPAHQLLVGERAVDIGRIEERDAEGDRAMDRGDGLGVIAPAVEVRHAHAAEAHGGHDEAVGSEVTLLHVLLPPQ